MYWAFMLPDNAILQYRCRSTGIAVSANRPCRYAAIAVSANRPCRYAASAYRPYTANIYLFIIKIVKKYMPAY